MYSAKTKLPLALALAAVLLTSPALRVGATPPDVAEWTKTPFDWTGFYIGMNIGGTLNNYDFRGHNQFNGSGGRFEDVDVSQQFFGRLETIGPAAFQAMGASNGPNAPVFSEDGLLTFFVPNHGERDGAVMGGAQIGYQHQFGRFVLGVEG